MKKLIVVTENIAKDIVNDNDAELYIVLEIDGKIKEKRRIYNWNLLFDEENDIFFIDYILILKSLFKISLPFYKTGKSVLSEYVKLYARIEQSEWEPALGEQFIGLSLDNVYRLDIFSYKSNKYHHGLANTPYTCVLPVNKENIDLIGKTHE